MIIVIMRSLHICSIYLIIRYFICEINFNFEDPLLKYKPSKKALVTIYKKLDQSD